MKKKFVLSCISIVAVISIILTGCGSKDQPEGNTPTAQESNTSSDSAQVTDTVKPADTGNQTDNSDNGKKDDDSTVDNDDSETSDNETKQPEDTAEAGTYKKKDIDPSYSAEKATTIVLNNDSATVSGKNVSTDGSVIGITEEGTYVLSGTYNGSIVVDVSKEEDVRLVLNGVTINCGNSSCIYVKKADKLIITLAEGTENTLTDSESYDYALPSKEEPNACIFTDCDLSINGTGKLTVQGNFQHAIRAKADIKVAGGTLDLTAADKGFKAKKTFSIIDGNITINAAKDGINVGETVFIDGGNITVTAGDDAVKSDSRIVVNNGRIDAQNSKHALKANVIENKGGEVLTK